MPHTAIFFCIIQRVLLLLTWIDLSCAYPRSLIHNLLMLSNTLSSVCLYCSRFIYHPTIWYHWEEVTYKKPAKWRLPASMNPGLDTDFTVTLLGIRWRSSLYGVSLGCCRPLKQNIMFSLYSCRCERTCYQSDSAHPNSLWISAKNPAEQIHRCPISPETEWLQNEDKPIYQYRHQSGRDEENNNDNEGPPPWSYFLVVTSLIRSDLLSLGPPCMLLLD